MRLRLAGGLNQSIPSSRSGRPLRLGILQADHVDPECRARFGDYADMFAIALGDALGPGASFRVLRCAP